MSEPNIVEEWLRYALNDLIVAKHCFNDLHPKQTVSFSGITSLCAHLTPYGVTARYPDELAPDEDMVKKAILNAQQVYDFCISKINSQEAKKS